jgi:hypothetical protein
VGCNLCIALSGSPLHRLSLTLSFARCFGWDFCSIAPSNLKTASLSTISAKKLSAFETGQMGTVRWFCDASFTVAALCSVLTTTHCHHCHRHHCHRHYPVYSLRAIYLSLSACRSRRSRRFNSRRRPRRGKRNWQTRSPQRSVAFTQCHTHSRAVAHAVARAHVLPSWFAVPMGMPSAARVPHNSPPGHTP